MLTVPILQYHDTTGDDLYHFFCGHDPDTGFCGLDISHHDVSPWREPACVVCTEMESARFTTGRCPFTGKACDCD